jgi:hypothetical protein
VLTCLCRLILYYPVSALVTLFANILQNPQDARARSDLKLMSSVVSFLTMLERDIIEANSNVRRMLSVCAEFERIASVALDKAEREMRGRGKRKQAEREREKAMKDAGSGKVAMGLEEGKTLEQMQIETQAPYRRPVDTASLRAASAAGSVHSGSPSSWHGSPAGTGPEFLSPTHPPRHLQSSPLHLGSQHVNGGFLPPQRPHPNHLSQQATSQQFNFSPTQANAPTNGFTSPGFSTLSGQQQQPQRTNGTHFLSQQQHQQQQHQPQIYSPTTSTPTEPRANGSVSGISGDPNSNFGMTFGASPTVGNGAFQQPFVPQDLWQMPMTLEWDWAEGLGLGSFTPGPMFDGSNPYQEFAGQGMPDLSEGQNQGHNMGPPGSMQ